MKCLRAVYDKYILPCQRRCCEALSAWILWLSLLICSFVWLFLLLVVVVVVVVVGAAAAAAAAAAAYLNSFY